MTLVTYTDFDDHHLQQYCLVEGDIDTVSARFIEAIRSGKERQLYYESQSTSLNASDLLIDNFQFKSLAGAPAIQKVFKDFLGEQFGVGIIPEILARASE